MKATSDGQKKNQVWFVYPLLEIRWNDRKQKGRGKRYDPVDEPQECWCNVISLSPDALLAVQNSFFLSGWDDGAQKK